MNSEELKKKAEELYSENSNSSFATFLRENYSGVGVQWNKPSFVMGFFAGHQLALDGASEGFDDWCVSEDRHGGVFSNANSFSRDEYMAQKGWQARGLLAAKREGELLADIEWLKKISADHSRALEAESVALKRIEKLREALAMYGNSVTWDGEKNSSIAAVALRADDKAQGGGV